MMYDSVNKGNELLKYRSKFVGMVIYTIKPLTNDIMEHTEWWNDDAFIDELDKEYTSWGNGSERGYTLEELCVIQNKHI